MNKTTLFFALFLWSTLCLSTSCTEDKPKKIIISKEQLIQQNKNFVSKESKVIDFFLSEKNLEFNKTATGLRYKIDKSGYGQTISAQQMVLMNYSIMLMDSTFCYGTKDTFLKKEFLVEGEEIERGIHEGIKLLKKGATATFILPPHLAHGLSGDGGNIPLNATLIYRIEVLDVY